MGATYGGGRRPDPVPLRLLKNDKAHAYRHVGKVELEPSKNRAAAPKNLSVEAKFYFEEFVTRVEEMYSCSETDSYAIALYANNHEQLLYLENYLRTTGVSYTADNGQVKPYPEVMMHKQCKDYELKILVEFGLTPSSRARVPNKPPEKKKNSFADLDEVNG